MMDKLWVGMLRSESKKKPPPRDADARLYKKVGTMGKGGTKKKRLQNTYTGSQTEVKEKLLTGPTQTVEEEGAEAAASGHGNDIARLEVEGLQRINAEQQHTISKLSSENARLVKQVDLLWQSSPVKVKDGINGSSEVQALRNALEQCTREKQMLMNELHRERQKQPVTSTPGGQPDHPGARDQSQLIAVLKESLDEKTQQIAVLTVQLEDARVEATTSARHTTHGDSSAGPQGGDTEQLSIRNSELSCDLGSVRQTQASLEKDVQALRRELSEVNTEYAQLREYSLQLQDERDVLLKQVEVGESQAQLSIDELGLQMEEAVMQKTAKIQELLDYAEELQDTLATLMKEKDLLTTSLREEAQYTRQLEEEKESMERQLSDSNGKLAALEEELQRISDMQDALEAGQRAADQVHAAQEADLVAVTRERDELTSAVGALQEGLRRACSEAEQKTQQGKVLGAAVTQLEREKGVLEEQLAALRGELGQMETKFASLHREMGDVQESAKAKARQDVERASSQLALSSQHAQQLLSEKATLEGRLKQLERQFSEATRDRDVHLNRMQLEVETITDKLNSKTVELEDCRATNELLHAQVSDLEEQMVSLGKQLKDSAEQAEGVTNTLSQKTAYISQLESIVEQQKGEILNWNTSQLQADQSKAHHRTSADKVLQDGGASDDGDGEASDGGGGGLEISSIDAPRVTQVQSLAYHHHPHQAQGCSSPNAEVLSLRQRLGESQQQCIRLEAQVANLKTEVAKMQGSLQALTTIKSHLTEHNQTLQEAGRNLEMERDAMQREREMVVTEMSRARDTIETLSTELSAMSRSKEELLSEYGEVQMKLAELQEEVAVREGEVCLLDDQRVAVERELESATEEVRTLQLKVESHQEELGLCQLEMEGLQQCVRQEASLLAEHASEVDRSVSTLKADALSLQEELHVAKSINDATSGQLEENERSVSALLGEVEALRAKRSVILQYVTSQDQQREGQLRSQLAKLEGENRALREEVQGCNESRRTESELVDVGRRKDDEISHLLGLLDEARKEKSVLQDELNRVSCPGKERDELLRTRRKLERMHTKMDVQSRQVNYLRIKLGYTLAELRLYKKLKEEMSLQLEQLQAQITLSQEQYRQCLMRLQQAGID